MDTRSLIQLLILLCLILLSGFFSSAETAMSTVNHIRIQALSEQGDRRALLVDKIISDPGRMLSTILIGNNIVNMAASALMTTLTIHLLGNVYVGAATGILTLLVLLFGEITPKTLASLHAEKLALSYANVIYVLMVVLRPVVFLVGKLANGIMLLIGTDPDARQNTMTEHELRTLVNVSEQEGVIEHEEKAMIYNVFDFGDSTARDVMIPRIDMTFVDVDTPYEDLMDVFRKVRHTRFPVYEDNTDNVIGIINIKDLLLSPEDKEFHVRDLLREPYFTYEYKPTADLMVDMRKASVNLAIVLDEYGSTAGLVTLEDLLEEIVGDIRDEYDEDEQEDLAVIIPGREYVARGSARLDDINEALHLELRSDDYDSIGGYIIEQLDSLPGIGQSVTLEGGARLVVDDLSRNRIRTVHIWLPEEESDVTSKEKTAE
ncbi:MAG: HlyC/CorC family transporter [Blautia sp.]|nr:HlyC/CorC family transporter [Blautia sp.]